MPIALSSGAVKGRRLYIATRRSSHKARSIESQPHVSLTVTVAKRIPLLPWITIPPATISFQGQARITAAGATDPGLRQILLSGLAATEKDLADLCFIEVTPQGEFVTYGIGVSLLTMRRPEAARGHAPV